MDSVVSVRKWCKGFYKLGSSWQLPCSCECPLSQGFRQRTLFCALLKLVADWSLVFCERRLGADDLDFSVASVQYRHTVCNGWEINVRDVPVNVNKIKPILKGKQHVVCISLWKRRFHLHNTAPLMAVRGHHAERVSNYYYTWSVSGGLNCRTQWVISIAIKTNIDIYCKIETAHFLQTIYHFNMNLLFN